MEEGGLPIYTYRECAMSNAIPDWMPPAEVTATDRDRQHRRDPRPQPPRQAPSRKPSEPSASTSEVPDIAPRIGRIIDVRV